LSQVLKSNQWEFKRFLCHECSFKGREHIELRILYTHLNYNCCNIHQYSSKTPHLHELKYCRTSKIESLCKYVSQKLACKFILNFTGCMLQVFYLGHFCSMLCIALPLPCIKIWWHLHHSIIESRMRTKW